MIRKLALVAAFALSSVPIAAQDSNDSAEQSKPAQEQLRHVIGEWDVTTTFYRDDGTEAGSFDGVYAFEWVMEDRIVKGMSSIPQFQMASAIMFYLRPSTNEIEMVSVGPDGKLWVMTGPQDSETRETPNTDMPDGTTLKLRFTRFNVSEDRFESKMERSTDGGETWVQGNHQVFVRSKSIAKGEEVLDALHDLAGPCWKGQFESSAAYDVMCAEVIEGGFLRTRHVVRGAGGSYSGETIYFLDPKTGEARYTYYTSLAAIQQGKVALNDGRFEFQDIEHVAQDGTMLRFKGSGELLDDGTYRTTTSRLNGRQWEEPSVLTMVRIDCASWEEVAAGCG